MMESSTNDEAEVLGVPPMITTKEDCNELINDPTRFEKPIRFNPNERERSTSTTGTLPESSSEGYSSCDDSQIQYSGSLRSEDDDDEDDFPDIDCSDDESTSSSQSGLTNNSTRLLLHQAQQRLHHQSVYEEVKLLRAEVSQYKNSTQNILRQKLDLTNRCDSLESQLAQAMETIQSHKMKELRLDEEGAEREKDFMNQLNDVCSTMEGKEQDLMAEIIKRDRKIIELQNHWNEEEMKRMKAVRERKKNREKVAYVEREVRTEIDLDDDNWSDECYGKFI